MYLDDICEVYSGYALKDFNDSGNGLPVIKIGNILTDGSLVLDEGQYTEESVNEKYYSKNGDIYIALSGATTGKIGMMEYDAKYVINQRVGVVRRKDDKVPAEFVKYFLLRHTDRILHEASGCAQPNISPKQIAKYEFPELSKEKMEEMSRILSKVDDLITHTKKELQKLDDLIKARFIELFGEPLSNTKGWQTMLLLDAAPIKSRRGDLADEIWLLNLDAVEAQTGTVLFKHRVQSEEINASTVYFTTENVLYSKLRPYLNKVVMPDEDGVATSEMIPMYPLADRLNRAYLCYWLRSDAFVKHISEKVAGAKMPRVSMDYFRSLSIELPPLELQEQFAAFVEQTDKSKFVVQKALDEA